MSYKNIDVQEFKELMQSENNVVIDVRAPGELVEGSIDGHQLINIFDPSFRDEVEKLDKVKGYLIYCRSGNRSGSACGYMSSIGFENLYNLSGGIIAWNRYQVAA